MSSKIYTLYIVNKQYSIKYSKEPNNQIAVSIPNYREVFDPDNGISDNFKKELKNTGWNNLSMASLDDYLCGMNWTNLMKINSKTGIIKN